MSTREFNGTYVTCTTFLLESTVLWVNEVSSEDWSSLAAIVVTVGSGPEKAQFMVKLQLILL